MSAKFIRHAIINGHSSDSRLNWARQNRFATLEMMSVVCSLRPSTNDVVDLRSQCFSTCHVSSSRDDDNEVCRKLLQLVFPPEMEGVTSSKWIDVYLQTLSHHLSHLTRSPFSGTW